ncbi:hypothetical protein E2C06_35340 [Dankookia rubra]|uniref:DUF3102 domain-containing protein n=1 Tax=Dankookia rubra TaxID=1442381 RepID=A0A4R5Q4Q8_9PROT|nr:hypothetical protein [Dankookia rubra]TDH57920.1 hypothetical protein E2C06_35340 [Dankookia rubra]
MSARASKRLLAALDTDEAPPADTRPVELERLVAVSEDVLTTIRDVFAGTDLLNDEVMVRAVIETRHEVEHSWGNAKRSFIEIGRSLNRLDRMMRTRAERQALKTGFEQLFPVSESIASQFRAVALAIDDGRLPEDACPASYSAAYQAALLEPHELEAARSRGLISPTTSRSALIAFRKQLAAPNLSQVDVGALRAEARRLDARLERLREEIAGIEARKIEIARILDADPDRSDAH